MTARESVEGKAIRYVSERRITVSRVDGDAVDALARSDSGAVYSVWHRYRSGWRCSCPARVECAHRVAVRLVVADLTAAPPAREEAK